MSDADLHRDLQRVRQVYRRKLPGKLDQLEALLREAREQRQFEAARRLAHMLKGTSGSYGLDEFSADLSQIEEGLDRLHEGTQRDASAIWQEIEHALARAWDRLGCPQKGRRPPRSGGAPDGDS